MEKIASFTINHDLLTLACTSPGWMGTWSPTTCA